MTRQLRLGQKYETFLAMASSIGTSSSLRSKFGRSVSWLPIHRSSSLTNVLVCMYY